MRIIKRAINEIKLFIFFIKFYFSGRLYLQMGFFKAYKLIQVSIRKEIIENGQIYE